jgi:hypothetical protein
LCAGIICLTVPAASAAQSSVPEFVPDRPDFTESSGVVGRHVVQLEMGLRLDQFDATTRQISTPQMLVRVGLGSRVEVRLAADGYVAQTIHTPSGREHASGRSDSVVSTKVQLLSGGATGLDVALLPFISLPTASASLGSASYDPGVKVAWAHALPWGVDLSGNANATSITTDTRRAWKRELSVSAGHGLGGPWAAYGEAYGALGNGQCSCALDTGISLALGANSQIDVEAGRRISGQAPDWFVGAGFAVRHRPQEFPR